MKNNKIVFIIPAYNASRHIGDLVDSLLEQTNSNWEAVIIDDMSEDDTVFMANFKTGSDERFKIIKNTEKKWALKNVIDNARIYQDKENIIIAILDADDALCNPNTVELLLNEYSDNEIDTVWTSHKWDINNLNISKQLPQEPPVNPYQYPWVTSHLKTFRASLLKEICDENFKNLSGAWFKRGYDQALYLPLLYKSKKRKHLNEVCYLYRINSSSVKSREWKEKDQMDTVRLVRARGFVK
tara:strand:+ start:1857 stop:2579 length:723 start_codon:yes stop_codon:yes gene_type:complete